MKTIKKKHTNINNNKTKHSLKKNTGGGSAKEDFFKSTKDSSGNLVPSELREKVFKIKAANDFLDLVKRGGIQFQEIPEEYINSEIILAAINHGHYSLWDVPHKHKKYISKEIILEELSRVMYDSRVNNILNDYGKEYLDKPDIDFMIQAAVANPLALTNDKIANTLLNSQEYLLRIAREMADSGFRTLDGRPPLLPEEHYDNFKNNRHFALHLVEIVGDYLKYLHDDIKCDKEICKKAISNDSFSYLYCCEDLKEDKDFCLFTIQHHNNRNFPFDHFPESIRDDDDVCYAALKINGFMIRYCSDRIRDNREMAKRAIKTHPRSLEYCTNKMKQDVNLCLRAIKADYSTFRHCDQKLTLNIPFCVEALGENPEILDYIDRRLLRHNFFLEKVNKTLQEDIVRIASMEIILLDYTKFSLCVEDLQNDVDFCVEFLKKDVERQKMRPRYEYYDWIKTRVSVLPISLLDNPDFKSKLESHFNPNIVKDIIEKLSNKKSDYPIPVNNKGEWKKVKSKKKTKTK